jgi:hypothetical protein
MPNVWYEPHPVTPARKKELIAKGYKIVDAKFKPPGWVKPTEQKAAQTSVELKTVSAPNAADDGHLYAPANVQPPVYAPPAEHLDSLTANELRAKLEAAGVDYPKYAPKAKLIELAAGL